MVGLGSEVTVGRLYIMSFIVLKIHAFWRWERSETPRGYPDTADKGPDSPGDVSGHSGW